METRVLVLTFQEVDTRYGLGRAELHQFLELGLLQPAPAPDSMARLHHGLGLAPEAIDIVMLMRQRMLSLQTALARETARARQLERFLVGAGPLLDE
jgi:chaperone modulatory protein CbpM